MRTTAILVLCIGMLALLASAFAAPANQVVKSVKMFLIVEPYAVVTSMAVTPDALNLSYGRERMVTLTVPIPSVIHGYLLHLNTVTINGRTLTPLGVGTDYLMNTNILTLRFDQNDILRAIGTSVGTHTVTFSAMFAGCGLLNATGSVQLLTIPEIPVLLSPGNGATGISSSTVLSWGNTAGAQRYTLEVANYANFSGATRYTSIMSTTMPLSGLAPGKTYYWRVLAVNNYGNSVFSPAWSFTTGVPLAVPLQIAPSNNTIALSTNPTITWKSVSGATSYTLEIADDTNFIKNVQSFTNLAVSAKTLNGLIAGKSYYWRVKAINASGYSAFSPAWTFTTSVPLVAPTLVTPGNSTAGVSTGPTLTWKSVSGAISYTLDIAGDAAFSKSVQSFTNLTVTSKSLSDLIARKSYYWRVKAINAFGYSAISPVWSFTTGDPLVAPKLVAPGKNTAGVSTSPTLTWKSVSGATSYTLEVSSDATFTKNVQSFTNLAVTSKTLSGLITGKSYYWRVKAVNASDSSEFSTSWGFSCIKK